MNTLDYDVVIIGGGAAGYFTAINLAEARPDLRIVILEKAKDVLQKVRISGGGRCNVTHAEFDPRDLVAYYPRGEKELLGPFHRFMTGDTVDWFESREVPLKIEEDGRMFPVSDSSQSIIDCLQTAANNAHIELHTQQNLLDFHKEAEVFQIRTKDRTYTAKQLVICAGSNKKMWELLAHKGHTIVKPVPSLFTFNINTPQLLELQGISQQAEVQLLDQNGQAWLSQSGPVLITHWGMSGPGILKLSAVAARELFDLDYNFEIHLNWLDGSHPEDIMEQLKSTRTDFARQQINNTNIFDMPKRLWKFLLQRAGLNPTTKWADLSNKKLDALVSILSKDKYSVRGKSTYKDEFVTAGGVELSEIDFKTFGSKKIDGLYLAGEVINVDALTGGFNFQNAWTGGYIIAQTIAQTT